MPILLHPTYQQAAAGRTGGFMRLDWSNRPVRFARIEVAMCKLHKSQSALMQLA